MASYTNILNHLRKWEGGLVYFPDEKQYTNKGIQEQTFYRLAPSLLGLKKPTLNDLKKLNDSDWQRFVRYFWNKATYNNSINNQDSANITFTAYFMSGENGIEDLQKKLNLKPDGTVGKEFVAKVNNDKNAPEKLYIALDNRFRRLAANNPARYKSKLKGWLNRLNDLYKPNKINLIPISLLLIGVGSYLYLNKN